MTRAERLRDKLLDFFSDEPMTWTLITDWNDLGITDVQVYNFEEEGRGRLPTCIITLQSGYMVKINHEAYFLSNNVPAGYNLDILYTYRGRRYTLWDSSYRGGISGEIDIYNIFIYINKYKDCPLPPPTGL